MRKIIGTDHEPRSNLERRDVDDPARRDRLLSILERMLDRHTEHPDSNNKDGGA